MSRYQDFLHRLGFDADPFAATNADEEESLESYFVKPPFFGPVLGDPKDPKSTIVFAPRGTGKTALKRKIELSARDENFACVVYNRFDVNRLSLQNVDTAFHLHQICRLILIHLLTAIRIRNEWTMSSQDRHVVYLLTKTYLEKLKQADLREEVNNVKGFGDRAREIWNAALGPVSLVANALLAKFGLGSADLKKFERQGGELGSYRDQLEFLRRIEQQYGYDSVYVLVDRVDETAATTKPDSAYRLIAPLLTDLPSLEIPGIAFKFFLWDLLLPHGEADFRPDRIRQYTLQWSYQQLTDMLKLRVRAFSADRVTSFHAICADPQVSSIDEMIAILADGSPRSMIRICKAAVDAQSELDDTVTQLSWRAIEDGMRKLADEIAANLGTPQALQELRRLKRCDLTIKYVYKDVFKLSQTAGMNKVRGWEKTGLIKQIGTIPETEGAKPSFHYSIQSPLVAFSVMKPISLVDFHAKKIRVCNGCKKPLIRDWDHHSILLCDACSLSVY